MCMSLDMRLGLWSRVANKYGKIMRAEENYAIDKNMETKWGKF